MTITIAIFIGLSLAVMFLFFYMFARDKELAKKFHLISAALENINQEIYKIQKHQKDESIKNVEGIVAEQLDVILENLLSTIKQSQFQNQKEIELLFDKISKLETNLKTISLPNIETDLYKEDKKKKAKELFDIGYSIEEIAKELNMPAGEVQLFIKF